MLYIRVQTDLKYRLVFKEKKKHICITNWCAKLSNTNLDHIYK